MKKLSKELVQQDIKELQKKLEQLHPNPYKYILKKDFCSLLKKHTLEANSVKDLGLAIMSTIPSLNDGHTYLELSDDVLGTKSFMFKFQYFDNGYYLTKASRTLSPYLGSKLLGINNLDVNQLEEKTKSFIPQENETSTQYYFSSKIVEPSILEFLKIKDCEKIKIYLEHNNTKIPLDIEPEDYNKKMLPLESKIQNITDTLRQKDSYWHTEIQDIKAFYFQYNSCYERADFKISEVVKKLKESKYKNIIIDLRNNTGGDSDVLKPFIAFFKKFANRYKTFIITGTDTYSSGIINLLELSSIPNSISIGEIPHGNPTHYGEVKSFILPNSNLKIFTSSRIFRFKGYKLGETFKPTHIVNTKIEDLLSGRDTQMNFIKRNLLG